MPVTEALMKPGTFTVNFMEETPYSVRSIFNDGHGTTPAQGNINHASFGFFHHVFITPVRLRPELQTLATLLASSRYTGIMRRRLRRGISGAGLLLYLGDDRGVGAVYDEAGAAAGQTLGFSAWVNDLVDTGWAASEGDPPYTVGTITNIGATTFNFSAYLLARRAALDIVCRFFGGEYRVNHDNTFDAGTEANLFVTTPTTVVLPRGGPRDISLEGLEALALDIEVDFEELIDYVLLVHADASVSKTVHGGAQFYDLKGQTNVSRLFAQVQDTPNVDPSDGFDYSLAILLPSLNARRNVRLTAGDYDIAGSVAAGDTVYVYDPDNFMFDTANQVVFGGRVIYPIKLRAVSVTWPIQKGMGVYYRNSVSGVVTDLSDYVAYESAGASLEVGAPSLPLVRSPQMPPGLARVF